MFAHVAPPPNSNPDLWGVRCAGLTVPPGMTNGGCRVHHVMTAVIVAWYNDDTIQSEAGTVDDTATKITQHPAVSGIFFLMILGASVACFNCSSFPAPPPLLCTYLKGSETWGVPDLNHRRSNPYIDVTLLLYHCNAGHPRVQGTAMGIAAIFSWCWQVPLFLYFPLGLIMRHADTLKAGGQVFYASLAIGVFLVDSKCNVVRLQIMREKLAAAVAATTTTAPSVKGGIASPSSHDDLPHRTKSHPAADASWDAALQSQSGLKTTGWFEDILLWTKVKSS
jgi:hypothetical protein